MASIREEASASLALEGAARGPARFLHIDPMDAECSSPAGHDEVSPTDGSATVGNQLPLRAMPRSS
jgi:hypothetical protein